MRVELEDRSGWVDLNLAKQFNGRGEDLFRVLSGSWVLRTTRPDGVARYRRIDLETAHTWLVKHGHYQEVE